MSENIFFNLGLAFIIIHEMDAIRCKEWRIIPGLNLLNDKLSFTIFMFAHIPLFIILFSNLSANHSLNNLIFYLELFFIIHLILHIIYLKNPKNEFKDFISWIFIVSPAIFGLIDLIINRV